MNTERICNQGKKDSFPHRNFRRTSVVVVITLLTMGFEIVFGLVTGSMALLADGIHMGTHAFALLVTLLAYLISKRRADDPNFAFSSQKVGTLGGYTNAILLGLTALFMLYEAFERLLKPEEILFDQALLVAVSGLVINLVSAFLLSGKNHGHDHDHHHDHNLKAAYVHVLTDALTSILAIAALGIGKYLSASWPDALVAIIGAVVILRWAYGLLVMTGKELVDYYRAEKEKGQLSQIVSSYDVTVTDLHIWKSSSNEKTMILSVNRLDKDLKERFSQEVRSRCDVDHLTVET